MLLKLQNELYKLLFDAVRYVISLDSTTRELSHIAHSEDSASSLYPHFAHAVSGFNESRAAQASFVFARYMQILVYLIDDFCVVNTTKINQDSNTLD